MCETKKLYYELNSCLARYSSRKTTTNQPTKRAPNEPARPICAQESIFWAKFCRFWAKNLIFTTGCKTFDTNIKEIQLSTLFALFSGQPWDQTGKSKTANVWQKMPILGQIWPFLGQKSIFGRDGAKLLVSSYQRTKETPFTVLKTLTSAAPIGH